MLGLPVHHLAAGVLQPVLGEGEACVVPVSKAAPDDDVPPLMRTSKNVKFSRKENLRNLSDVEEEGTTAHEIHEDDSWQEDPDLVIVQSTIQDYPVDSWHTAPNNKGHKVDEPDAQVLLLVEVLPGEGSEHDEDSHRGEVEITQQGVAPECVVNSCITNIDNSEIDVLFCVNTQIKRIYSSQLGGEEA